MNKRVLNLLVASSLSVSIIGCSSNAGTGALVGGAGGAVAGGLIGSMSHARAGAGALIGGAAGALGGALIGSAIDAQEKKEHEDRAREDRIYAEREYSHPAYSDTAVRQDDVITWTQRGEREEIIIDRIERSGTIFFLTPADEARLRNAGVSEHVIQVMRDTAHR